MSTSCGDVGVTEQLCYIPCNFCNILLAVSVPCSSLYEMVTVRCGHCSNLWSVNMAAAVFQALSTWQQEHHLSHQGATNSTDYRIDLGSSARSYNNRMAMRQQATNPSVQRVVNRPPEKRQRVPSAYNQFIKEEIQRIKANNPDIIIGKPSVQLPKIGHVSLIIIFDSCWRAITTNPNLTRTLGSFECPVLQY